MLSLKKLRLKGIGRFVDMQEVSFENLGNLIQVDGQNNNTGGSSGAAKTTLLNAHDFVLGLNSIPNSLLQSRLTEDAIFVEEEYDFDGVPLIISRGKKLKITLNGEVTTGSSKITEEKLDQILGIPRDLFRLMQHKKQGERGFFLSFTPGETNSFLTDCLGLGKYKKDIANLDDKISDLSKMISSLTSSVESTRTGLKASKDAIAALGSAPTKDVDQETVLRIKTHFDLVTAQLKDISEKHQKELKELESQRPVFESISFDTSLLKKYEKELEDILKLQMAIKNEILEHEHAKTKRVSEYKVMQAELNDKVRRGKEALEEATKCAAEILKIRNSTCPRCEQSWVNESAKSEEAKILEKIDRLKAIVVAGETATMQRTAAQEKLDFELSTPTPDGGAALKELDIKEQVLRGSCRGEKEAERNHNLTELNKHKSKVDTYTEKERVLKQIQNAEMLQFQGQVELHRRTLDMAAMKFKNYEEVKTKYDSSLKTLEAQYESYADKGVKLCEEIASVTKELGMAEELKKAIKSYLSCSFDEALETISENATKMIQNIPNMANATIQLDGTKETKEGKVKEEVNSVIHMDGEENIPIKTLSGGERASVDIAIDLAVLGYIEDKTNKGIDVFILDEPFTGLDSTNIEMILEVLKNANTNKKLIVIDHNPIVKEQISDRITVVRDGLTSRVVQN